MGLLLAVVVHPANIQDRDGARLVIDKLIGRFPRLRLIWADAGYSGQLVDWVMSMSGWVLEIVKRPRASHQFEVLPRRWVVERTLAWLGRCRRLSKDYEALTGTATTPFVLSSHPPSKAHATHKTAHGPTGLRPSLAPSQSRESPTPPPLDPERPCYSIPMHTHAHRPQRRLPR